MKSNPVIVALDMPCNEAKTLVTSLGDRVDIYKVGLELFVQSGTEIIQFLEAKNKEIFLDLKLYDIPNTVHQATKAILQYHNIRFFTIHALGGKTMLEATIRACEGSSASPIAVTILTSFSEEEWAGMLPKSSINIAETALQLAQYAYASGVAGVVCSAHEAGSIKQSLSSECITICPGIRPKGTAQGDQQRTMTPKEAVQHGADYLVIGRPITQAKNPVQAVEDIIEELV